MSVPFPLINDEAMLQQPDQEYLIDGVCSAGSLVLMHGQSGAGKSFLGLDAAFAVATGTDWHGHAVKNAGTVVYVAAEGQGGLKYRIQAWKAHHGLAERGVLGVHFFLGALDPLNGTDVHALCHQLRAQFADAPPKLVMVDTYAECLAAGAGDENSTRDTGKAVAGWKRIVSSLGATVWLVHHQGVNYRTRGRGNTALKAAAETEIAVAQSATGIVSVTNLKQRDFARFAEFHLRLQVVKIAGDDLHNSCVLIPADAGATAVVPSGLPARAEKALAALRSIDGGATHADWRVASGQSESTFERAVPDLTARGYITKRDGGRGALYTITEAGRSHLHPHITPTDTFTDGALDHHHQPSPPRRGDGGGGEGDGNQAKDEPPEAKR